MAECLTIIIERLREWDSATHERLVELKSALNLNELTGLRRLTRYEIAGLSKEELERGAPGLLFEMPIDRVVETLDKNQNIIAWEYLPGQFDKRADSAARGLSFLYPNHSINVSCAELVIPQGNLKPGDLQKIESWIINPVDSRPKDLKVWSFGEGAVEPEDVPILQGFAYLDDGGIEAFRKDWGVALSTEDLSFIQVWYLKQEERDPSLAEIRVLDTYWSDHCRHTTFETELAGIQIDDGPDAQDIRDALEEWEQARYACRREDRPRTLMDLATIAARELRRAGGLDDWELSEEVNACTLRVDACIDGRREPWLLSFKNETHNHPTEIEPYGGASTCIGGAVRDPLADRAYVYQALRVSAGGDPRVDPMNTLPGKLPQRLIAHGAAEGYAGYGNQLGLACTVVREYYHRGYQAKRLECGGVMGASPAKHIVRIAPAAGDVVIMVGGPTGRDGIGGATGSSVSHDGESLDKAGAEVQKGNPPEERKIQRLFRNPEAAGLIRRCNDFGAGGVAVAVGELAPGLDIDLDALPVKYAGLDGVELAISESQERMAVVVQAEDVPHFIKLAGAENLEAVAIAKVTDSRRLRMFWRGQTIVDLNRDFLDTNGVRRRATPRIAANPTLEFPWEKASLNKETLLEVLSSPEVACKRGLEERFDGSVGGYTVLAPHGGLYQMTPAEASVHLLPAHGTVTTASLMSVGFDPELSAGNPFRGAQFALIEALARVCAAGAPWRQVRFSLQEYFGTTDRGETAWGRPLAALLGALTVQRRWRLPAIGGKDSMSGSFKTLDVPPTLIAFAAVSMDARLAVGAALPLGDFTLALIGPGPKDLGTGGPDFQGLAASWDWLDRLRAAGRVRAAASVGPGGWAAKLVLMALGNRVGVELMDPLPPRPFAADYGRLIVAVDESWDELSRMTRESGIPCVILGRTVRKPRISWPGDFLDLHDAQTAWFSTFAEVWPMDIQDEAPVSLAKGTGTRVIRRSFPSIAKPRVCIPIFQGTNGEDDARRAFHRVGGEPVESVFLDRKPEDIPEALESLAASIACSQILYLSGGFSAGDEPDGAGKYVAAVLRHSKIVEAVRDLLDRDGLIFGICNGFQALLKSGWLVDGNPKIPGKDAPTLVKNRVGRHVARMVRTVATGAWSPWLMNMNRGDVHVIPVSHGEGRFVAPTKVLNKLEEDGRIAFQYCDEAGRPSMSGEFNPNGSDRAVEGILSPCGRILGKMGHSERWRKGTFIDVPGFQAEQPLMASGVNWFK